MDSECHDMFAEVSKEELQSVWPLWTREDFMLLCHAFMTLMLLIFPVIAFIFGIHGGAFSWEIKAVASSHLDLFVWVRFLRNKKLVVCRISFTKGSTT